MTMVRINYNNILMILISTIALSRSAVIRKYMGNDIPQVFHASELKSGMSGRKVNTFAMLWKIQDVDDNAGGVPGPLEKGLWGRRRDELHNDNDLETIKADTMPGYRPGDSKKADDVMDQNLHNKDTDVWKNMILDTLRDTGPNKENSE